MIRLVLLAIALLLAGVPASAAVLDDAQAVDAGRAMGRALLIFRDPYICAPVVRVRRCLSDLRAFFDGRDGNVQLATVPGAGPKPYNRLRAYIVAGDPANIDRALAWLNHISLGGRPPREIELMDGGIAATLFAAANGNVQRQMVAAFATVDAAKSPPAGRLDLLSAGQRALLASLGQTDDIRGIDLHVTQRHVSDLEAANAAFVRQVDEHFPAHAWPDLRYDGGVRGFVRLGIAFALLRQLLELPELAALPESRAFSARAIQRFVELAPAAASSGDFIRSSLGSDDRATRQNGIRAVSALIAPLTAAIPERSYRALLIGSFVAQLGYNAATFRETRAAATMIGGLARQPRIAGLTRDDVAGIAALRACAFADFACQRRAATAAVEAFEKP